MSVNRKPGNLNFAANLSFMFRDKENVLERYNLAKSAGFNAVETAFLYDYPLSDVVQAKVNSGLQQILINSNPGNALNNELGFAVFPSRVKEFRESLSRSIELCKALECTRLHVMAGRVTDLGLSHEEMEKTYLENLKYAATELSKEGIVGLIEPINQDTVPGYFLNSFEKAIKYLKEINNSEHMKLQLDLFHLQRISGNLTKNIKELLPFVGHIQIAQVPDRHEPNSPGEIDYQYVFNLLRELGYDDWIGLEYFPEGDSVKGLSWIKDFGYSL